ncbi:MAG: ribose-phosphate pyrophosphokinase [Solirubrobacterales bacterium]
MMLYSGRVNPSLAEAIAARLGLQLGPVELRTFSDSEVYCRLGESVRGADVFLIQPTCGNPEAGLSTNDALMELLVMVDAAVGASAHRVIAVSPWFGYSRQDKKSAPREPISARLVARLLEAAGVDRVLTMDLHTGQMQGFFSVPVDHMTAMTMLCRHVADLELGGSLVVVAPDAGRAKLNKKFADVIGAGLAILAPGHRGDGEAESTELVGDVTGKTAIIVDDIIDTAETLRVGGETLAQAGAARVYAAATHGIFSGDAFENLAAAPFEQVVVTDTIPLRVGAPDNVRVLSCDILLSDSIRRIFIDESVSEVFDGRNLAF